MPSPRPTSVTCDACGLAWGDHLAVDGEVSLTECVRLLRTQLDQLRAAIARAATHDPMIFLQPSTDLAIEA